jgi:predicted negative regulator of RcsB-dependent stress response
VAVRLIIEPTGLRLVLPPIAVLASKIGHALVRTHDYTKAINYYEAAVKSGGQPSLRQDLAQLYLKLKQPDKAAKVGGLTGPHTAVLHVLHSALWPCVKPDIPCW